MKPLRVLLIDATSAYKKILETQTSGADSVRYSVTLTGAKQAESTFTDVSDRLDTVLFGERIAPSVVLALARVFHTKKPALPIFVLTKQSEARLPRKYMQAGVDDVLNVADFGTPLFSWTFTSAVENATLRKKARAYDVLHHRLRLVSHSLATLIHDITNPLGIVRLALYLLEKPELPQEKQETFFKLLIDNLKRLEGRMSMLYTIRRQIDGNGTTSAKILAFKPLVERTAADGR
jgi:signal transduction histidine kinase